MDRQTSKTLRKMRGIIDPISLGFIILGIGALTAVGQQKPQPISQPATVTMEVPQPAVAAQVQKQTVWVD